MLFLKKILRKIKTKIGNLARFFYYFYLKKMGVKIGTGTMISIGAKIDVGSGSVVIGNKCTITHGTVVLSHDAGAARMKKHAKSICTTTIENNVFIGVNCVILPGITIGENSIIGAGTVVTKSVPRNSVVVGNPGKVIRARDDL